jgi:DNA-binding transcriptional MerR regulator
MNREEREGYVIRLYKENKSTREIAKLMHMSFRDIGAIIKKVKFEANGGKGPLEEHDDFKSKSKITQAVALFSEFKSPVDVIIALDLPANQVRVIYQEFWELEGMYRLAQIYEEAKCDLDDLLRLHRIVKDLGMNEQDIRNVLDLVKNNQLQTMQREAERIRSEINTLETEKTEAMSQIFRLKRRIHESEETLTQRRKEIAHMDKESGKYDNNGNLHPVPNSEPDSNSHSNQIVSYAKE